MVHQFSMTLANSSVLSICLSGFQFLNLSNILWIENSSTIHNLLAFALTCLTCSKTKSQYAKFSCPSFWFNWKPMSDNIVWLVSYLKKGRMPTKCTIYASLRWHCNEMWFLGSKSKNWSWKNQMEYQVHFPLWVVDVLVCITSRI